MIWLGLCIIIGMLGAGPWAILIWLAGELFSFLAD